MKKVSKSEVRRKYKQALKEAEKAAKELRTKLKENPKIKKVYVSRAAYEAQKNYMKMHSIQVREDKQTKKFKRINTDKYQTWEDMCKDNAQYEYIQNSVNSLYRDTIVIDCDNKDFGKETLDVLNLLEIVPYYQKVKTENGHSQTAIRIWTAEMCYYDDESKSFIDWIQKDPFNPEKEISERRMYLTVTQLLNIVADGDLGFTGSNCQNPYCTKYGYTKWFENSKEWVLRDLYIYLLNFFKIPSQEKAMEFIKSCRNSAKCRANKIREKVENASEKKEDTSIAFLEDVMDVSQIKLLTKEVDADNYEDILKLLEQKSLKAKQSVNYLIYELVNQHFTFMKERNYKPTPTSLEKWMRKVWNYDRSIFKDYTFDDYITRVRNDFKYVEETHDLSKAAYTETQRTLAFSVRQLNSFHTWLKVQTYKHRIAEKKLTIQDVAERIGCHRLTVARNLQRTLYNFNFAFLMKCMESIRSTHKLYKYLPLLKVALKKIAQYTTPFDTDSYLRHPIFKSSQNNLAKGNMSQIDNKKSNILSSVYTEQEANSYQQVQERYE